MIKKFTLMTAMLAVLGLCTSQLFAMTECTSAQYACCPATNQGGSLTSCISTIPRQYCNYSNGTQVTFQGTD